MTDLRHDYIQTKICRMNEVALSELNAMWDGLVSQARAQFAQERCV